MCVSCVCVSCVCKQLAYVCVCMICVHGCERVSMRARAKTLCMRWFLCPYASVCHVCVCVFELGNTGCIFATLFIFYYHT